MKKSILIALIATSLFTLVSFKENPSSSKEKKNETKQSEQLFVSAKKMNILYVGLNNPIDIVVSNENNENITVETDNGTIEKMPNSEWIAKVVRTGKTTIKVYIEKNGKKQLYGEREFRAYRVPEPSLKFDGQKEMSISKERLINNPKINLVMENLMFDTDLFNVASFTVRITDKNSNQEVKCEGTNLSKEAIELIKKAAPECTITFDDIKIADSENTIRKIQPISLTLK